MPSVEFLSPENLQRAHLAAQKASRSLRLPFGVAVRTGLTGGFVGRGTGSSVDFHDHRLFLPGDDPRYIDWLAYGRTGQYTLKLYREEVRPQVDILLDCSRSMFFLESKAARAIELLYFALESALQAHAAVRCFLVTDAAFELVLPENLLGYSVPGVPEGAFSSAAPDLRQIPVRQDSLRVLISDLLFPGSPGPLLLALGAGRCQPLIFTPFSAEESDPHWSGNIDFIDCEDDSMRKQSVDAALLRRYREIYGRHFLLWKEECAKYRVRLARVADGDGLTAALQSESLAAQTVELWNC